MVGKIAYYAGLLRQKQLSARELTQSYLDRIARDNPALNAYITVAADFALAQADAVDRRRMAGEDLPMLAGIPMTVKDNISTKGILTTCASKILSNYVPVFNAFAVERIYANGGVMLGKTNLDEFGMGSTCEHSAYGATRNPVDRTRVPGGSSGGGAAAVAADLAVYALGSDTGGSIRQPSAFCGTVGFKPTYGMVSRWGLIAYASSLDQIGVIAPTVEDAAIVTDAIALPDPMDATCSPASRPSAYAGLKRDVKGLKIGLIRNLFRGLNPVIENAVRAAAEHFRTLGAEVVEVEAERLDLVLPVYYILACAEAASNLSRYDGVRYGVRAKGATSFEEMVCKTRSEGFGDEVKRRIMLGNYVLSSGYFDAYYKKAQEMRNGLIADLDDLLRSVDCFLAPTVASTAFGIGEFSSLSPVEMYLTDLCTVPVNVCGLPAISLPCGKDEKGLPIGLQLIGKRFADADLLAYANAYQTTREG